MARNRGDLWSASHTLALFAILGAIILISVLTPSASRQWAWLGTLALMGFFTWIAGHGITGLWRGALIDERNKMSLSRLQVVLWTLLVLSGILVAVLSNVALKDPDPVSVTIPQELWVLLAISTTSLVASPLMKSPKKAKQPDEQQEVETFVLLEKQGVNAGALDTQGLILRNQDPADARWSDLFRGEETGNAAQLDLAKIQMFFFTIVLVIAYGAALAAKIGGFGSIHEFPPLSDALVALLGISHGGYLLNKAVPHSETT